MQRDVVFYLALISVSSCRILQREVVLMITVTQSLWSILKETLLTSPELGDGSVLG